MSMVILHFDEYDWDDGNLEKNLKSHGISHKAIESFFQRHFDYSDSPKHSQRERRLIAIGSDDKGHAMMVVFTMRTKAGKHLLRPISARLMHVKEVQDYEKGKKK
jgi:uncharacterized DUF497 family protein